MDHRAQQNREQRSFLSSDDDDCCDCAAAFLSLLVSFLFQFYLFNAEMVASPRFAAFSIGLLLLLFFVFVFQYSQLADWPSGTMLSSVDASPLRAGPVEKQLEVALRQMDHTRRLYQRLHQHNDDMEAEFLRLRGVVENVRNRLFYGLRHDVHRLRSDMRDIRETVQFHSATFQREIAALGRVLHGALTNGAIGSADTEILFQTSGRGAVPRKPSSAPGRVPLPLPVSSVQSPLSKYATEVQLRNADRGRPAEAAATNPLRDLSRRPSSPLPSRRAPSLARQESKQNLVQDSATKEETTVNSIEFFSDAEGQTPAKGSPSSELKSKRSETNAGAANGARKRVARRTSPTQSKPNSAAPVLVVAQATELAQQRATAERQAKQLTSLTEELQRTHFDNMALQKKIAAQEHDFQSYLKQVKLVHKEQEATLRSQLEMMSQVAAIRADGEDTQHPPLPATRAALAGATAPTCAPSSALRHAIESSSYSSSQRKDDGTKKPLSQRRAQAEQKAQRAIVASGSKRHTDVLAEGLWAQRVLEQRGGSAVRPLFPASRSSSVHSDRGGRGGSYATQQQRQ